MKFRNLLMFLLVLTLLLGYNLLCYFFVNDIISRDVRPTINNYFKNICNNCDYDYKFKKATPNYDGTLNIFVKVDSERLDDKYFKFMMIKNGYSYEIVNVSNNVPAYIK